MCENLELTPSLRYYVLVSAYHLEHFLYILLNIILTFLFASLCQYYLADLTVVFSFI